MAQKLIGAMAGNLVIGDGYTLRFEAVDPTTGAAVSGVTVSNVDVDGDDQGGAAFSAETPGLFRLVPGPNA